MEISSFLVSAERAPTPRPKPFWAQVTLSLGTFAAVGASLGLFFALLSLPTSVAGYITGNSLTLGARNNLVLSIIGWAGTTGALGALAMLMSRGSSLGPIHRTADLISPLVLLGFVPGLFLRNWHANPLPFLLLLTLLSLLFERAMRRFFSAIGEVSLALPSFSALPARTQRWVPFGVVATGALAYSIYFSYYTIQHHQRLGTAGFDLGINVNWCYNALHGHLFRVPTLFGPDGGSMIAGHAIFGMLALWLPFYAMKPGAEVLLIYQATIVGLAAIPLYLFARTQVTRWAAVLVALSFLLSAPLHGANFYDFHELPVALFFHFSLYYGLAVRSRWLVIVNTVILYSIREDIAVGMTVLGLFLVFSGLRPREGAALAVASAIWFGVDKFVIMPAFGKWWFANIYAELMPEGDRGYGGVMKTMLGNPAFFFSTLLKENKLIYFLHLYTPLLCLPLRRWWLFILSMPGFLFTIFTTGYAPTVSIAFQYTTHCIPYLFVASVLMLRLLASDEDGKNKLRAAVFAMGFATLAHSFVFGAVLQHETMVGGFGRITFKMTPEESQRYDDLKRLVAMIPREASVAATENENPHIAVRLNAYTLKDHHGDADFLLINKSRVSAESKKNIERATTRNSYGLLTQTRHFFLFKKGHQSPDTQGALTTLGLKANTP